MRYFLFIIIGISNYANANNTLSTTFKMNGATIRFTPQINIKSSAELVELEGSIDIKIKKTLRTLLEFTCTLSDRENTIHKTDATLWDHKPSSLPQKNIHSLVFDMDRCNNMGFQVERFLEHPTTSNGHYLPTDGRTDIIQLTIPCVDSQTLAIAFDHEQKNLELDNMPKTAQKCSFFYASRNTSWPIELVPFKP